MKKTIFLLIMACIYFAGYSTVMSAGDDIKILSPAHVRGEIVKLIEASLNQY